MGAGRVSLGTGWAPIPWKPPEAAPVCSNSLPVSPESQILDFGLARHADAEMTGYVVTRWYRAPEVILSWMHYNQTGQWAATQGGPGAFPDSPSKAIVVPLG